MCWGTTNLICILESEEHPCKRFLDTAVEGGHNLKSCKINPAPFRIPVSRTVRHKQSFIPRGAKLNLLTLICMYVCMYVCMYLGSALIFNFNITVILIAKGNK